MNEALLKATAREVVAATSASASAAQKACRAHHFGPWMIDQPWLTHAVDMINRGQLQPRGDTVDPDEDDDDGDAVGPYKVVGKVAVIPIAGAMMKARSKFGGTSTIDVRNAVRAAGADDNVKAILLHIDSPGGTTAGTDALAQDVAAAGMKKPVYAHIEDMGASAAYWVASQADRITASRGSMVGSLGTRMAVIDSSAAAAQEGIKVLSFATGEFKAAGLDGTVVTERQAAYFQQVVDDANSHFKAAVASGRSMTPEQVDALFDGRVHDAAAAKSLGLIDEVSTLDAAVEAILQETSTMDAAQFKQYAAANPSDPTITDIQFAANTAGKSEGVETERKRARAIAEAAGDNHKLAVKAIVAGHSAESVKLAAEAVAEVAATATAKVETTAADVTSKDAKIAQLEAQVELMKSGQSPVPARGAAPAAAPAAVDATDHEAVAKSEWAQMSSKDREAWADEAAYVGLRKVELSGRFRSK